MGHLKIKPGAGGIYGKKLAPQASYIPLHAPDLVSYDLLTREDLVYNLMVDRKHCWQTFASQKWSNKINKQRPEIIMQCTWKS